MAALLIDVSYGNRLIGSYGPIIAEQQFEPAGFPMRLGRKDVGLALAAAGDADLLLTELIASRMDAIIAAGGGEQDWAAISQRSGICRRAFFQSLADCPVAPERVGS
ncbi:hypothetical protein [Bosea vaviloviae]|uniref:hypothetical protein n=1 Tax=Bosea vaviloviae TaxID=1526658 RepID=UPI0006BAE204|nr:hypothetical protein [Bosea vaviloviae]